MYNVVRGPAWVRAIAASGVWLWLLGWALIGLLGMLLTGRLPKRLPWALVQVKNDNENNLKEQITSKLL